MIKLTFSDNIEKFLSNNENFEVLEDILDKTAQEYFNLEKSKDTFYPGKKINPGLFEEMVPPIVKETNDFLGAYNIKLPIFAFFHVPTAMKRCSYFGLGIFAMSTLLTSLGGSVFGGMSFSAIIGAFATLGMYGRAAKQLKWTRYYSQEPDMHLITLNEKWTVPAVGDLAHEYDHHMVNKSTNLFNYLPNPIIEGHARGVEGKICKAFSEKFDNPAFEYNYAHRIASEINDAYHIICEKKNIYPMESLKNLKIPPVHGYGDIHGSYHYKIGSAAMHVAERRYDDKVYKDVLKSDFWFLRA